MVRAFFGTAIDASRLSNGAEDGIRTRDLRFTKPLLYQLSEVANCKTKGRAKFPSTMELHSGLRMWAQVEE